MANNSLELGDESFEEEPLTAAQVLSKLERAWLNEKFSPELLPNKSEIVDCVLEQLHEMQQNIDRAKKGDFKVGIHKMELDRIRYILSNYLRTRLHKIENFTLHVLEKEKHDSGLLTSEELKFAEDYQSSVEAHFKTLALKHMPHNLQTLDKKQTAIHPNLDSYVFLRVDEDVEGVNTEEETDDARDVVDFVAGDQHLMCYRPVADLIIKEKVTLI